VACMDDGRLPPISHNVTLDGGGRANDTALQRQRQEAPALRG